MKGALFRSILFLLPLAALAAAEPEGLGFNPASSHAPDLVASIYIAPENECFYRMRFPDGYYREFQNRDAFSGKELQELWSPNGWIGGLKRKGGEIYICVQSSTNVVGGRASFLFKGGRIIQFEQGDKLWKFPYEIPRPPTAGGAPDYFPISTGGVQKVVGGRKWLRSERGFGRCFSRWLHGYLCTFEKNGKLSEDDALCLWFDNLHIDKDGKGIISLKGRLDLRSNERR